MARRQVFTNSLASGEIAPEYLSRSDITARSEAAKSLINVSVLAGGGVKRRDGTRDLAAVSGDGRLMTIGVGSSAQLVLFAANKVRFMSLAGALVQEVTGAPWAVDDLHTMQIALEDSRIVVTSQTWPPQVVTKTNGTWSLGEFAFAPATGGALRQPYYRFPGYDGVSLTPSSYSGSITVLASSAIFVAEHVGARFRYTGVEMIVTGYTSPTLASADVVGSLYPTILVNVINSSVFIAGQEVSGLDSNATGVVVSIPDATHVVVQLTGGYSYFDWTSSTISEKIVSPTGVTAQGASASVLVASPAATLQWDEQLISAARGYPGSCALHRTRLLYGNFPSAVNMIAASAVGDITDFDTGTGLDTDAIVELIGRDGSVGIRHFGSTEQLLFFTQSGSLYVPEQVGAPLSPTNFELLKIGPEAAALPVPILVSEGMLFVEERSGRVMATTPTGNVRRSWQIADLSELAFHLMGTPVELGLLAARTGSDRKVVLVRSDGALSIMSYRRAETISAWMRWQTVGAWRSAVAADGSLFLIAKRTINGVESYRLEVMDASVYGDGVVSISNLATAIPQYANQTMSVWDGTSYLGDFLVGSDGLLVGVPDSYAAVQVGFDSQIAVDLVPPIDGTEGLRRKTRIVRVDVEVVDSGAMKVNGYDPAGYVGAVGVGGAVGLTSGVRRFRPLGRQHNATAKITQDHAGPFQVRSITMEVTS